MFKKRLLPAFIALAASGALNAYAQTDDESAAAVEEEIIVTGVRNAEMNARQSEREKNIFSSVIAQDDAGNFADQNVAEALQRLPGVTLQKSEGEGRFVTLRGLGPGFVGVSMNGNELASAGSDSRDFALDALSADALSGVEVFKSLTPDMDLNSIAGRVNVKTITAFDRQKDSLRFGAQVSRQDYSGEASPKFNVQGSNLFLDDTVGLGYSLTYEERSTDIYQQRHHASEAMTYRQKFLRDMEDPEGPVLLSPWQFETREEQAERTRLIGTIDLGWRPTTESEYYIKYSHTSLEDLDIALREYYRVDLAFIDDLNNTENMLNSEKEIAYIDPASGTFGVTDAELQHQFFIQKGEETTRAFEIGGKNIFNDVWTLDFNFAHSVGEFSKPDGRRVQFRIQDLPMLAQAGDDYFAAQIISPADMASLAGVPTSSLVNIGGYFLLDQSQRKQGGMTYDNIFIEDSFREDTLEQFTVNLRRDFNEGFVNYVKAGVNAKWRERDRDKDRWSIVPGNYPNACSGDAECETLRNTSLANFETHTPNHPDFQYDFITRSETERLLAATSRIAKYTDPNLIGQESRKEDYLLTEDSSAAFAMAEFQLSEKSSLITGVRYEKTDFVSDGYLAIRNDRFAEFDNAENSNLDIAIPLQDAKKSYSDFFPSIHYRYDMNDNTLVRAALWTSYSRPGFDQSRAFAEIVGRVNLCNPDTLDCNDNPPANGGVISPQQQITTVNGDLFTLAGRNTLRLGNPNLVAMTSNNFDTSISWYGDNGDHWQLAAFYKDINDFVVEVRGASLALDQLPLDIPFEEITQFGIASDLVIDRVNFATNGDKAKVYGIELSYEKYFDSGFFVQSNLTLIESEAEAGDTIRSGKIQLPDQADETLNLTLGWERDGISTRLIGNYRSEILKAIGGCTDAAIAADAVAGYPQNCRTWSDIYQNKSVTLDFKTTYQLNEAVKFTFDATNLTKQKDISFFEGNEYSNGNVLYGSDDYGRTFLLGVTYNFM